MKIKCTRCKQKDIEYDKNNPSVCITCYPSFVNTLHLNCEEKGHSRFCKCPSNPLNKQLEQDASNYVSPTVTADDFPEPGLPVEEFLKSVTNDKDRIKLKMFFYKFR